MERTEKNTIQLTPQDHLVLDSLRIVLDGLADYLGDCFEFVLHSLENLDASVVKIINGHHTGRTVGAPITNLALTMLDRIEQGNPHDFITYFSRNRAGEPLKACTIAIRGENQRIIGLLCINCYLNTPLYSIIQSLAMPDERAELHHEDEYLADSVQNTIGRALEAACQKVNADESIPVSLKKKQIIFLLYTQGIFKFKEAVGTVAAALNLSPNTVYLHIRSAKSQQPAPCD